MTNNRNIAIAAANVTADLPAVKITREDIRKHFCALATDQEVAMGLAIVKSLNLNPFLREVHFVKYDVKSKMSIIVGYEVYIKRAERPGKLYGWSAGINTAENYSWVKIWRKDWKEPFEWQVNLGEFNKKQSTWNQIPSFMGRKVAIAQGFRLCFPDELGGMPYTQEEHDVYDIESKEKNMKPEVKMPTAITHESTESAEMPIESENVPETAPFGANKAIVATDTKLQELEGLAKTCFAVNKKKFLEWIGAEYGVEKITELTDGQIVSASQKLAEMIKNGKK